LDVHLPQNPLAQKVIDLVTAERRVELVADLERERRNAESAIDELSRITDASCAGRSFSTAKSIAAAIGGIESDYRRST
jgi:hypothetical protein